MNLSPWFILLPVLVPIVSGFGLLVFRFKGRLARDLYVEGFTILTSILTLIAALGCKGEAVFPISFPGNLTLTMRCDGMSMVFALLVAFLWPFASLYAFCYMEPEKGKNRFFETVPKIV